MPRKIPQVDAFITDDKMIKTNLGNWTNYEWLLIDRFVRQCAVLHRRAKKSCTDFKGKEQLVWSRLSRDRKMKSLASDYDLELASVRKIKDDMYYLYKFRLPKQHQLTLKLLGNLQTKDWYFRVEYIDYLMKLTHNKLRIKGNPLKSPDACFLFNGKKLIGLLMPYIP